MKEVIIQHLEKEGVGNISDDVLNFIDEFLEMEKGKEQKKENKEKRKNKKSTPS